MVGGGDQWFYRCDRPWSAGVINGSIDVVECMLEHGGAVKLPIFKMVNNNKLGSLFYITEIVFE